MSLMLIYVPFDEVNSASLQTFHVYESGSTGPVCFCLHGGGFSALSWAVLSVS